MDREHALSLIPPIIFLFVCFIYIPYICIKVSIKGILSLIHKVASVLSIRQQQQDDDDDDEIDNIKRKQVLSKKSRSSTVGDHHQVLPLPRPQLIQSTSTVSSTSSEESSSVSSESELSSSSTTATTTSSSSSSVFTSTTVVVIVLLLAYAMSPLILDQQQNHQHHLLNRRMDLDPSHTNNDRGKNLTISTRSNNLYDMIYGTNHPKLYDIIQKLSSSPTTNSASSSSSSSNFDFWLGPKTPIWLLNNRHLQFIPWLIQNEIHRRYFSIPYQTKTLKVKDCIWKLNQKKKKNDGEEKDTGDCIPDPYMDDTITLDIFPPFEEEEESSSSSSSQYSKGFNKSSPIIIYAPGITCHSQDLPGTTIIRLAYQEGFRSIIVNRRGHHSIDAKLNAPRFNLLGDVTDMEQVYWYIVNELLLPSSSSSSSTSDKKEVDSNNIGDDGDTGDLPPPMFLYGISAGTAVTVSGLSHWDERNKQIENNRKGISSSKRATTTTAQVDNSDGNDGDPSSSSPKLIKPAPKFVSAVHITPGYDISNLFLPDRFQFPYNGIVLSSVKQKFVKRNQNILKKGYYYDSNIYDQLLQTTNLQEFVDASVIYTGYTNTTEYYTNTNPINNIQSMTTPGLVLNSYDDPCCHIGNLYETSPYTKHQNKTYATMVSETSNHIVVVTKTGSHGPFLNGYWLPIIPDPIYPNLYMLNSWSDQLTINYFRATLDVYYNNKEK